ncbi:MAG TPA: helix-turn-helix domain-containing protein [Actinophytocola sp.]|uniref:helix-turn-helix domain-containing protein n=1 Tax=Actinophytocola sp. TaxID=1872138 RepID=UPI002DBE64D6|nr:helix-turn-helix domain-containing protein [Actinophytocola sp.]HEU5470775.1 helix-turn-helix domain-containing protein [Actinophytocola sp.]
MHGEHYPDPSAPVVPTRSLIPAAWMWSAREASAALASRDLGTILRTYRRLNGFSQQHLADLLGYDKTYVSMMETGRRSINDIGTRRHIARTLCLPVHIFGVTDVGDADFAAMVQFGDSTIRLAEIARQAGRAVEAVNELWPLTARLEARAANGDIERHTLVLLGRARLALGVSLGAVLPEERLAAAARWTGKALIIAERIDDPPLLAHTLRMHGNELRKANRIPAAIARLRRAVGLSADRVGHATALAFLARAAGEFGHRDLFDSAMARYRHVHDGWDGGGILAHPFTVREIHMRGLVSTGRAAAPAQIMQTAPADAMPSAPAWHVIERVTAGEVHLAAGDHDAADEALRTALTAAEAHRLPHQIQRAIRVAARGGLTGISTDGQGALVRVNRLLAPRGSES